MTAFSLPLLPDPVGTQVQVPARLGGRDVALIWDTGATTTCLTPAAAADGPLRLGSLVLDGPLPVVDVHTAERLHGRIVDGVVGADLMGRLAWLVDRPAGLLRVFPSGHPDVAAFAAGASRLALRPHAIDGGQVWATEIRVDGHALHRNPDTGAHRSIGTAALGALLGRPPDAADVQVSSPAAQGVAFVHPD